MIPIQRRPLPEHVIERMRDLTLDIAGRVPDDRKKLAVSLWDSDVIRREVRAPVREVLSKMAPGIDNCMYCGKFMGNDVEHYEPKSLNPLRTFCWYNHLLVCAECNRIKGNRFKPDDLGQPLLIDPTCEDPFDHMHLVLSTGEYKGWTKKGKYTVDLLKLNSRRLAEGRAWAFGNSLTLVRGWKHAFEDGDQGEVLRIVRGIWEQPFADVWQAMLRQAVHPDADLFFRGMSDLLDLLRRPALRAAFLA